MTSSQKAMKGFLICAATLLLVAPCRNASLLKTEYGIGDKVNVTAGMWTTSQSPRYYMHYDSSLFDMPMNGMGLQQSWEGLGALLRGDLIVNTDYEIQMGKDVECRLLQSIHLRSHDPDTVLKRILLDYSIHLLVDGVPCVSHMMGNNSHPTMQYERGYHLGSNEGNRTYVNNHVRFTLSHNTDDQKRFQVVGCQIDAHSYGDTNSSVSQVDRYEKICSVAENPTPQEMIWGEKTVVKFTYSVEWRPSKILWHDRWEMANAAARNERPDWIANVNMVAAYMMCGMIAAAIAFSIRKDIAFRQKMGDVIWISLHGNVFRPPKFPGVLSVLVGFGILATFRAVYFLGSSLGRHFSLPYSDPTDVSNLPYMLAGLLAGFVSSSLYATIGAWQRPTITSIRMHPILLFGAGFLLCTALNQMFRGDGLLFFLLSVIGGCYLGCRLGTHMQPVQTSPVTRALPHNMMEAFRHTLMAGFIQFSCTFTELYFIFTGFWEYHYYRLGYLVLGCIVEVISCMLVSIGVVYFQLCRGDYQWWWSNFLISGASALLVCIYSMLYSWFLSDGARSYYDDYVLNTVQMVVTLWLLNGTIGFYAVYWFVRKIYGAARIDSVI